MPFEPLNTDEKLDQPIKKRRDFEGHLMAGCMAVGLTSALIYILSAWPWLVFENHRVSGMTSIVLFGLVPSLVVGAFTTWRFGFAGVSGSFGGGMIASIFIWLRMKEVMLGFLTTELPRPEYPERWGWMIPGGWFVSIALVSALCLLFRSDKGEPEWAIGQQFPQDN